MVGSWRGYLSGARCRFAYGPADATATHCLLLQYNPDWFTFLVPAHPGSPGKGVVKRARACVCVRVVQRYSAVVTHLDGGLDGRVVLRPPVEALDAVLVFLAVAAQRRFALLLRFRRPAFHFLHRTLKYAIVAESLLYILSGADLGG